MVKISWIQPQIKLYDGNPAQSIWDSKITHLSGVTSVNSGHYDDQVQVQTPPSAQGQGWVDDVESCKL